MDLGGLGWTLGRVGWTWVDLGGLGWTWVDLGGLGWIWVDHFILSYDQKVSLGRKNLELSIMCFWGLGDLV